MPQPPILNYVPGTTGLDPDGVAKIMALNDAERLMEDLLIEVYPEDANGEEILDAEPLFEVDPARRDTVVEAVRDGLLHRLRPDPDEAPAEAAPSRRLFWPERKAA